MSQKQACAIFATSFLAGLLVTAVTFQPFTDTSVTAPYFGFPGESAPVDTSLPGTALNVSSDSLPTQRHSQPPSDFSNLPNELAKSLRSTFGHHLLDSTEETSVIDGLPSAKILTPTDMVSLKDYAERLNDNSISVAAFNRPPGSDQLQLSDESHEHARIENVAKADHQQNTQSFVSQSVARPTVVHPEVQKTQEKKIGATENLRTDLSTSPDDDAKQDPLPQSANTLLLKTKPSHPSTEKAANLSPPVIAETQGHVGAKTDVVSPDSLRALVLRTQTQTNNLEEVTAENTESPRSSDVRSKATENKGTDKGLRAAALALRRTTPQVPVQSLLTRTFEQPPEVTPARKKSLPTTIDSSLPNKNLSSYSKETNKVLRPVSAEATKSLTRLSQPKRWKNAPDVRLSPRYARPHTDTAPSPPLQLEQAGNPIASKLKEFTDQQLVSDKSWVNLDEGGWTEAITTTQRTPSAPPETPRERIVKRLAAERKATAIQPPPNAPSPASAPFINEETTTTSEPSSEPPIKRIIERLRPGERLRDRLGQNIKRFETTTLTTATSPLTAWPPPKELLRQLDELAADSSPRPASYNDIRKWADQTVSTVSQIMATRGPQDPNAISVINSLEQCFQDGMSLADSLTDLDHATQIRRTAFAVKRRMKTWHAAAVLSNGISVTTATEKNGLDQISTLLRLLEDFETDATAGNAFAVQQALKTTESLSPSQFQLLRQAIIHYYAAPNVRIACSEEFLTKLMPESPSRTESVREIILGKPVRGRREVKQTTSIDLTPDTDEICFDLTVEGQVSTYAITETGPIALTSRGSGQFTVKKPIKLSYEGLVVGRSVASASNRARLMNVSTSFDSVPLMGSLLRTLARNQHADSLPEANREVAQKIIWQSCRETDRESEEKFTALSNQIDESFWQPLIRLGLSPTPFMETTEDRATLRLRISADTQLAAHTPRPREPNETLFGYEVHESTVNNTFDRLGINGERLSLENLFIRVQQQLGLEPEIPEDLPEGVAVTFEEVEPLRVDFDDGLVEVKVAIDALESGRRNWYDVIGSVTYKPVGVGNTVFLQREGPIRISGPGHRGRIEFALRTIFGKIFPKERPLPIVPKRITDHPRLQNMTALQAVSWDGWIAVALGGPSEIQTAEITNDKPSVIR